MENIYERGKNAVRMVPVITNKYTTVDEAKMSLQSRRKGGRLIGEK
jgi:hypothetical protein